MSVAVAGSEERQGLISGVCVAKDDANSDGEGLARRDDNPSGRIVSVRSTNDQLVKRGAVSLTIVFCAIVAIVSLRRFDGMGSPTFSSEQDKLRFADFEQTFESGALTGPTLRDFDFRSDMDASINLYEISKEGHRAQHALVDHLASVIVTSTEHDAPKRHKMRDSRLVRTRDFDVGGTTDAQDCYLSVSERCSISSMKWYDFNNVYPGGETGCLLGGPFFFQVVPRDMNKVLIFFQGGGCCWDEGSAKMRMCSMESWEQENVGIFDGEFVDNPFRDFTTVSINYCSGDVHVGNADPTWKGPHNAKVQQRGYLNAKSAVDWTLEILGERRLDSFVVAGSSAGALGVIMWARTLLTSFDYRNGVVVTDSFIGVFPPGVQGKTQKEAGVCGTGLLSLEMEDRCNNDLFDIHDVNAENLEAFPHVPFVTINSKTDIVQMAFHDAIYMSLVDRNLARSMQPQEFNRRMRIVQNFHGRNKNYLTFDVNSRQHEYLNKGSLWNAEAEGMRLHTWLAHFPVRSRSIVASKCTGTRLSANYSGRTGWELCDPESSLHVYQQTR